jgi:hypothetical protein
MSDEQPVNEKIEVEGHGFRGPRATADEVEGHPFYKKRADDAEAPESTDLEEAGADDAEAGAEDDPDVEGHPFARVK